MINTIILEGRLTADPEIKTTANGKSYCQFSIAVDRNVAAKDGNRATDFIDCTVWNKSAEFLAKYFHKGDGINVQGSLNVNPYTDKDGNKRRQCVVAVREISFPTGGKRNADANGAATPAAAPAPTDAVPETIGDDDLPF